MLLSAPRARENQDGRRVVRPRAHSSRVGTCIGRALLLCGLLVAANGACGESHPEPAVKAAMVLRITGYVTWPEATPRQPLIIAVLGAGDVAASLRQLVSLRQAQEPAVEVRLVTHVGAARKAQVLYVGRGLRGNLRSQ